MLPKKGKGRRARKGKADLVKVLDETLSKVVRLEAADANGLVRCFTCSDRVPWRQADAGHYVRRGRFATRWDRRNVKPQCQTCNRRLGGNLEVFARNIDLVHGPGTARELENLARKHEGDRIPVPELERRLSEARKVLGRLMAYKRGAT